MAVRRVISRGASKSTAQKFFIKGGLLWRSLWKAQQKGEHYRKKGARLTEDADEAVLLHKPGIPEEYRYQLGHFHLIDKAHLIMLAEEQLIPDRMR